MVTDVEDRLRKRILVTHDDHTLRDMFADLLLREGYPVMRASKLDDAFQIASRLDDIALVIANLGTDRKGLKLFERLKAAGYNRKFAIVTGGGNESQAEIESLGILFLELPINNNRFLRKVEKYLSE
ncbi:MAG: hypothetical protein A3C85_01030 [Candidatus Doudnabacteria bacterium RIFCSPHIGHO2_02_FULL_48_21]|nr:MAG: hypothetical protein A3K05_04080 [Candidatus Doudnabacteria bacterium RIFCSPHIGHO2_01_48_18]OGE77247.1 MAG: hypothetical protein A2668_03125 [Candidatus Doudnabacteria bacterium RIFCSPHIGHO2_01_FULL_48_180]OGE91071.1 MAG: hypothetical protein A3F44_01970 [Candidatus Doudnabacteria bacterium RIFCSPHIGHO2_12_FULL_47_25]OGE93761.1 MAG: hypothetical protein A3C85_01030 [Candidatus Doudnabacteria bacterium RIFCSPHIGHO2_02_FULL_48_21]OGE97170.1 MAG: hypothetical protein A3A83_01050 [Candidatu